MKKLALAASLAAAFSGSTFAQSSVTLYGRINTSINIEKSGGQTDETYLMRNNSSRWGLRGIEDLGGGLKAFFGLESGFNSDTGAATQAGKIFSRDAYVGLQSESLGRLQMGHMTSPLYYATADYISNHNHDTGVSADAFYSLPTYYHGTTAGDVSGFVSNAVQYSTPNFGGFVVTALVAAGEGSATLPKGYEISAVYDNGPIHLGGGCAQDEAIDGRQNSGCAIRGLFELGPFVLGAMYERNDYERNVLGGPASLIGKRNHVRGSVMYTMGAAELHANAGWADDIGDTPDSSAVQYTLGLNYNLSKRTKVYSFYTRINSETNAPYGDFRSFAALGIRHNF